MLKNLIHRPTGTLHSSTGLAMCVSIIYATSVGGGVGLNIDSYIY